MKSIRLNWGSGIAVSYLGFVAMILVLVVMSTRQKIDLVTNQYYVEELQFQDKIEKIKRANELTDPLTWEVGEREINIRYPASLARKTFAGEVRFYCPANDKNDRKFKINASNNSQSIPLSAIPDGRYHLQIDWKSGDQSFWNEGVILIDHSGKTSVYDGPN